MQIYVAKGEQQTGPFSEEQIRAMVNAGEVALSDLAWHADLASWEPLGNVIRIEPLFVPVDHSPQPMGGTEDGRVFLYIPKGRLIVMSLLTLGIYDMYWIFHNWRFLKRRDKLDIYPFWRAVFGYFFIYPLLKAIRNDPQTQRVLPANFNAGGLAAGWIVMMIIGNALGRADNTMVNLVGILISCPSFLFLLPVQSHINALNEALPQRPTYYGWSTGHVVCLVVGLLILLLVIAGLMLPEVEG